MKTVKFLQRVNVIFLALILFSACTSLFIEPEKDLSTISFSKIPLSEIRYYDSTHTLVPYGTGPLVDLEFGTANDSIALYIPADTSIYFIEVWVGNGHKPTVAEHGDVTLTLDPIYNVVSIYTTNGTFSIEYMKGAQFGYVLINEKIVATYDLETRQFAHGSGVVPENFIITDEWLSTELP